MYVINKNIKNIFFFLVKFSNFTVKKNLCILHGRVFVKDYPNHTVPGRRCPEADYQYLLHISFTVFLETANHDLFQHFPVKWMKAAFINMINDLLLIFLSLDCEQKEADIDQTC